MKDGGDYTQTIWKLQYTLWEPQNQQQKFGWMWKYVTEGIPFQSNQQDRIWICVVSLLTEKIICLKGEFSEVYSLKVNTVTLLLWLYSLLCFVE